MPSATAWKKAAKRWRAQSHRDRDRYWRTRSALNRVGVSVNLALRVFDDERGDRTTIMTDSTEPSALASEDRP